MIGKAIGAVLGVLVALGVLMPSVQKNISAVVNSPLPATAEQRAATHAAKHVFDWKCVFDRYPSFTFYPDPHAHLVTTSSSRADNVGLEKINHFTTVHLAIDELERGGFALRLTIEPGHRNDGAGARLVPDEAMIK